MAPPSPGDFSPRAIAVAGDGTPRLPLSFSLRAVKDSAGSALPSASR